MERSGGAAVRAEIRRSALAGRKLAVSFHVAGESGPMTWHAKALRPPISRRPAPGAQGQPRRRERRFRSRTTSWYFLDAVDMMAPARHTAIVAFGDSITDGTASTLNGDDRWPDVLSRRLHAAYGDRVAVVNAGIGGNQVVGPPSTTRAEAVRRRSVGAAASRARRAAASRASSTVIWLEGINDFSKNGNASVEAVAAACATVVSAAAGGIPGVRVIGATVTSALGSTNGAHGSPSRTRSASALNEFIRTSGIFDGVVDFDRRRSIPRPASCKRGVRAGKHDRRAGRQAAPEPPRVRGDGRGD